MKQMDIILNEKSLEAQFTQEGFLEFLQNQLISILKLLDEHKCILYKKSDAYSYKVTPRQSLFELMKVKGDPAIDRVKTYLHRLYNEEPFWDLQSLYDAKKKYNCNCFDEIPNCAIEAYERGAIILSFENDRFLVDYIDIVVDQESNKVRNCYCLKKMEFHFTELGIIQKWQKNSFRIERGYLFEIRFREDNHSKPHFHVTKNENSASYAIPELTKLAGCIENDDEKAILTWAQESLDKIIEQWNLIHQNKKFEII